MIYFYRRAGDLRTCEIRAEADGEGYELIVTEGAESRIEHYEDARELGDREIEVRQAWFAHGWRSVDPSDDNDDDNDNDEDK